MEYLEDQFALLKTGKKEIEREVRSYLPAANESLLSHLALHGLSRIMGWQYDLGALDRNTLGERYEQVCVHVLRRMGENKSRLVGKCRAILRGLPEALATAKRNNNMNFTRDDTKIAIIGEINCIINFDMN